VFISFEWPKETEPKKRPPYVAPLRGNFRSSSFAGIFQRAILEPVKNARRPCCAPSGYSRKGLRCSLGTSMCLALRAGELAILPIRRCSTKGITSKEKDGISVFCHSGEGRNPVVLTNYWMPDQVRHDGRNW